MRAYSVTIRSWRKQRSGSISNPIFLSLTGSSAGALWEMHPPLDDGLSRPATPQKRMLPTQGQQQQQQEEEEIGCGRSGAKQNATVASHRTAWSHGHRIFRRKNVSLLDSRSSDTYIFIFIFSYYCLIWKEETSQNFTGSSDSFTLRHQLIHQEEWRWWSRGMQMCLYKILCAN